MRHLFFLIAILAFPLFSFSISISPGQAARVAHNFYYERVNTSKATLYNDISVSRIRTIKNSSALYYVCEIKPAGFVVVSACDQVIPILAYSFESDYAEEEFLPEGFNIWMDHYSQQIEYAISNNVIAAQETTKEWNRLLSSNFETNRNLKQLQSVAPLLVSKWNQSNPYNNWCPLDPAGPGGRCYAGCVATAMGQLLYYYRFPHQGQGGYTYTHPDYGVISADFGSTTYHWDRMPSSITKNNDAIGELLFHQGVSVDMDYGPDGSGMWNHKTAYSLKTFFRYGPETQYYFRDSVTINWDSLLITNLDQRKPLYYAGWAGVQSTSGHAFVCDGYQPGNYYHFNWGWGGSQDGYFYTANLTPGGNNFNFAQEVIPLFPDTLLNTYPVPCQGFTAMSDLRGSLEDGSGWYNYQDNASCTWLIAPQDAEYDSIKNIKITFLRFDTEETADTLYLYDGSNASAPLLAALSGNSIPGAITSSGNKVFIKFHTNSSVTKPGWQLDYESNFPVYCTGITTLTAPSGSIEDGSGDKKYSNNSSCRWKILSAVGMPVIFNFTSFETSDSNDFVKIYDLQTQELLGAFNGGSLPPPVMAMSGKMLIIFMTNNSGNAQGWSGSYYTSGVGRPEVDPCINETFLYPNPASKSVTLEKYFQGNSNITIRITDAEGKPIYSETMKVSNSINKISLNIEYLKEAVYFVMIQDGSQNEAIKLIVSK